jgi:mono/diheme cytochrome c family protein
MPDPTDPRPSAAERRDVNEPVRQEVVGAGAVRAAAVVGSVGMLVALIVLLVLATARPQGRLQALDDAQHQALLREADARLTGFDVHDDGAARLDIEHAMRLVAERGVDLPLVAGGVAPEPAERVEDPEGVPPLAVEGEPVYAANCAACHQAGGTGIPGAFPPLADHVYELYGADRDFLPLVLLYGLQGPILVHGQTYDGLMPAFPQLGDDDLAAVLNHVLEAWGDAEAIGEDYQPYAADEIEELRGQGLSGADVHQIRQEIGLP